MNQCDGCCQGNEADEDGFHRGKDGLPFMMCTKERYEQLEMQLQSIDIVKPIEWTEPSSPNEKCAYDHVFGKHPLGEFRITWKSWKDSPSYDVDEAPHEELEVYGYYTLEDAKKSIQAYLEILIKKCLR